MAQLEIRNTRTNERTTGRSPSATIRRMFGSSAEINGRVYDGSINTISDGSGRVLGTVVIYID